MQVPEGDNVCPGSDIVLELMSEEKETLLEKKKAYSTIFEFNFIFSQIFICEWTLSLRSSKGEFLGVGLLAVKAIT